MDSFGINWGAPPIPTGWKRRFRQRIKIEWMPRGYYYDLKGVALDRKALHRMLIEANNGHRLLHIEERKSPLGPVWGIYTA